jgi:hypothetical protein
MRLWNVACSFSNMSTLEHILPLLSVSVMSMCFRRAMPLGILCLLYEFERSTLTMPAARGAAAFHPHDGLYSPVNL